jgi:hypothetical protein
VGWGCGWEGRLGRLIVGLEDYGEIRGLRATLRSFGRSLSFSRPRRATGAGGIGSFGFDAAARLGYFDSACSACLFPLEKSLSIWLLRNLYIISYHINCYHLPV